MKIKSFFAPNLVNALNIIETLYKKEAVIHSVTSVEHGVKVSVFIKKQKKEFDTLVEKNSDKKKYFSTILKHLSLEESLIDRFVRATKNKSLKPNDDKLLISALDELFQFKPIYPISSNKVYVLVGNSGSGKTTVLKKMTLIAKKENLNPVILSIDQKNTDLENFSKENDVFFQTLDDLKKLNETVTLLRLQYNYILIDTPPFNPFNREDMKILSIMRKEISDGEFILTLPAGLDAQESVAQGAIFNKNGCTLLLATKMDSHVKYSGLLQTLIYNPIPLTGLCFSNKVEDPVLEATPSNISKFFLLSNS